MFWRVKSKRRKAAGSPNSGVIWATENAARRRLFAAKTRRTLLAEAPGKMLIPLAVIALLAGACGSGGEDGAPPAQSDNGNEDDTEHAQLTVEAFDFGFDPDSFSVDTGEIVHIAFSNTGQASHTLTSKALGFDVRVDGGGSGEVGFVAPDEDGTYAFQCTIHPGQMQGEVIVGTGGDDGDTKDTDEGAGENDTGVDY
jgi:plastocyanin